MKRLYFLIIALISSLFPWPAWGTVENLLVDVRIGPHKRFDRVVFEFQSEVPSSVARKPDRKIEVRFSGVAVREGFRIPSLPRGLAVLRDVKAFRQGEDVLIFELSLATDATTSELALSGNPWRLAVDLAPRSEEAREEKPEYIPGDRPIPTTFAEQVSDSIDSTHPEQACAVLAYYYLARGDSVNAHLQAEKYRALTGMNLGWEGADAESKVVAEAPSPATPPQEFLTMKMTRGLLFNGLLPILTFIIGAFTGHLALRWIRKIRLPRPKLPKLKLTLKRPVCLRFTWKRPVWLKLSLKKSVWLTFAWKRPTWLKFAWKKPTWLTFALKTPPSSPVELAQQVEKDLKKLKSAVKREPQAAPPEREQVKSANPRQEPAKNPLPISSEDEVRESLMDRRVRRVLELAKDGREIVDIAQELEMGQDEVKLILDLNQ